MLFILCSSWEFLPLKNCNRPPTPVVCPLLLAIGNLLAEIFGADVGGGEHASPLFPLGIVDGRVPLLLGNVQNVNLFRIGTFVLPPHRMLRKSKKKFT